LSSYSSSCAVDTEVKAGGAKKKCGQVE
jgi:hypothetical protein